VRSAARAFGPKEAVARAKCVVAEGRDSARLPRLGLASEGLDAARVTLEEHGDRVMPHTRDILRSGGLLLVGRIMKPSARSPDLTRRPLPPPSRIAHELVVAGIAMRRLRYEGGARCARPRRASGTPRTYPCPDGRVESALLILNTHRLRA